jgi:hypothetical protein
VAVGTNDGEIKESGAPRKRQIGERNIVVALGESMAEIGELRNAKLALRGVTTDR